MTNRLEDHKLMGLTLDQLEAQWAAMCAEYGWTELTSAQERLERIKRLGMAPGYATSWMMKFIEAWDAATAANLEAFVAEYGADDEDDEDEPEKWLVIGSSGPKSVVLHDSESQRDCIAFARGYTAHGDFGGWAVIEVVDARADGDVVLSLEAPELDDEYSFIDLKLHPIFEGEAA